MAAAPLRWASKPVEVHCDMGEAFGNWTMVFRPLLPISAQRLGPPTTKRLTSRDDVACPPVPKQKGVDEAIMPHITSCSIACGFHAGDPVVMYRTVKAAQRHEMKMDPLECEKMVIYQIGALKAFLDIEGLDLSHVSPHGALYGVMAKDKAICEAVCHAVRHFTTHDGAPVPLIGASNTLMETTAADLGIPFVQEVIADLEYDENGDCIIPRTHDAVDPEAVRVRLAHALRSGTIEGRDTKEGKHKKHVVDLKLSSAPLSLCVHSDTPGAAQVAGVTRDVVDDFNEEHFA
ncbi:lamB/YcsF family protein [Hirsutella rhossiliensis]|uniref:LamB/YcsF family domain-containing protein n=1 Tax=Hirsutella rhossiliensis TaxID=111463 RepID=A0A9P8SK09_9HYPO|nr:lamB/YcsF family domain-containing protein [Hirsutella rhossiliensis]KAH0965461.1 lamB/YcsF family domain-containing protein [Hirsutella rhossiliensis]